MEWSRFFPDYMKIYAVSSAKFNVCLPRPQNIQPRGARIVSKKRHLDIYKYEIRLHLNTFLATRKPH